MAPHIFIIEHLEQKLWDWCIIEYKHISEIVGQDNLWFTNINEKDRKKLEKFGKVFNDSVRKMNLKNACVLDPEASQVLAPEKAKEIDYFIFGGILGDYPPKKRTSEELTRFLKYKTYNLGKDQMSTDNAVFVVKQISEGTELKNIEFQKGIEVKTG